VGESKRILLVEDHDDTREMVAKVLRRDGYIVVGVSTTEDALWVCDSQDFDLLISDIALPDGSGLDLMRKVFAKCKIKGIAYTAFGYESDIAKARAAGFSAHILKPADFSVLQETVKRVLASDDSAENGNGSV
jgi:CheY-like chemotaxis protein